ncbi:MAG TPA: hypothetical protein DGG95_07225 [Cytophagales bacterium]|nr:hypothetical protein [Cytophagales bacterium]
MNDRKEDIPDRIQTFLEDISNIYKAKKKTIQKEAIELLQKHSWTGNIRELRNVVERLVIMSESTITPEDVKKYL